MIPWIFLTGAVLRLCMMFSTKSLWGDEWFSVELAQKNFQAVFWGSIQDVHPPVYFLLLHGAIRLLGEWEWVYRFISLLAGILTIVLTYLLAKETFDSYTAKVAALLIAVSPYALQSSNEIRSYSLLGALSLAVLYSFVRSLKPSASILRWRVTLFFLLVAVIYVEHYAWFVWFALFVCCLYIFIRKKNSKSILGVPLGALLCGLPSLALIVYQAVFREGAFQLDRIQEYRPMGSMLKKAVAVPWHYTNGYAFSMLTQERIMSLITSSLFFWASALAALGMFIAAAAGAVHLYRKSFRDFLWMMMAVYFPIIFLWLVYPIRLESRYLSFAAPLFLMLGAAGITRLKVGIWRIGLLWIITTFSLGNSLYTLWIKTDAIHREDPRGMVQYVLANAQENDVICGMDREIQYYARQLRQRPKARVLASLNDLDLISAARFRHVWVMDGANMHSHVMDEIQKELDRRMGVLGFHRRGAPMRFGGENGLTMLYLYINNA